MSRSLSVGARRAIARAYERLDYRALGGVYCYEGGDEFWRVKRQPCQRFGSLVAVALRAKLARGGRSLYVGAGVAELPVLLVETLELQRRVEPYNLRRSEVTILNRACRPSPVTFLGCDATAARGRFDHLWIVSVLNDPERFPHVSRLSYGRADPVTFDSHKFDKERRKVRKIVDRCMRKLVRPGLVTTSTEEVVWIAEWCHRHKMSYRVERRKYETALVGDPICFIKIGK